MTSAGGHGDLMVHELANHILRLLTFNIRLFENRVFIRIENCRRLSRSRAPQKGEQGGQADCADVRPDP